MFSNYLARQPIFDINMQVRAYELLYRQSSDNFFPNICKEHATRSVATDFHLDKGNHLAGTNKAFINFTHDSIIKGLPYFLDPQKVVIEVLEGDTLSSRLLNAIKELHQAGYDIALDDYTPSISWSEAYPFISYIKFDFKHLTMLEAGEYISHFDFEHIKFVAERIETREQLLEAQQNGFHLFQGFYLAEPEIMQKLPIHHHYQTAFESSYQTLSRLDAHQQLTPCEQNLIDYLNLPRVSNQAIGK